MGTDHQDGEMKQQGNGYGQLSLSVAGQPLRTYWLTQTRTVIGRRATNALVLDDLTVSGEHAVLMAGQQDVVIQDLGSRNGTLVNGAPVVRALLNDGDSIDIGIYRLIYHRAVGTGTGTGTGTGSGEHAAGPDGARRFTASTADTQPWGAGAANRTEAHQARPADTQNDDASHLDARPGGSGATGLTPDTFPPLSLGDTAFLLNRLAPDFPLFQPPGPTSPAGSLPPTSPSTASPSGAPPRLFPPVALSGPVSENGPPASLPPGAPEAGGIPGTSWPPGGIPPAPGAPQPSGIFSSPFPPASDEEPPVGSIGHTASAGPAGSMGHTGFIEGFNRAPRLPPTPVPGQAALPPAMLPHVPPPMPRVRPALDRPADFQGVSLRFLGGHDAGRLLVIDRPIVSIRNGCGQVAVVTHRNGNFFLTHVEGSAYPMVNGESIGLGAHPLRNHDLIELSGTIIQFSQSPAGSPMPSGNQPRPGAPR